MTAREQAVDLYRTLGYRAALQLVDSELCAIAIDGPNTIKDACRLALILTELHNLAAGI